MNEGPLEKVIRSLTLSSDEMTLEQLKVELTDRGIDADALLSRVHQMIQKQKKEDRTAWMKVAESNKNRMESSLRPKESWRLRKPEDIREAFEQKVKAGEVALAFRNKQTLTEEVMARILDNLDLLP